MPRIPYVEPTKTPRTKELLDKLQHRNLFKMLGHSESHFQTYVRMGNAIRFKGELDPGLRELAITRTGILCEAPYEIVAHERIGRGVGLADDKVAALRQGAEAPVYTELEKAVLRFTDEVVQQQKVSDATFKAVQEHLTPGALVELHLAIGFYIMTSKFLETFGIDMEPSLEGI